MPHRWRVASGPRRPHVELRTPVRPGGRSEPPSHHRGRPRSRVALDLAGGATQHHDAHRWRYRTGSGDLADRRHGTGRRDGTGAPTDRTPCRCGTGLPSLRQPAEWRPVASRHGWTLVDAAPPLGWDGP